jgi:hypothetical protein
MISKGTGAGRLCPLLALGFCGINIIKIKKSPERRLWTQLNIF